MRVQFIEAKPNGDITLSASTSMQLKDYNWAISGGNIPAAYLTGYLAGKKALKSGIKRSILDLGLQRNTVGSRIYATLKGIIDAGIDIPSNDKVFPEDNVVEGSHIKIIGEQINSEDKKEYKKRFTKYVTAKVKPGDVEKLVNKTKSAINKAF
jgi:large subunit ribosomal protein L18